VNKDDSKYCSCIECQNEFKNSVKYNIGNASQVNTTTGFCQCQLCKVSSGAIDSFCNCSVCNSSYGIYGPDEQYVNGSDVWLSYGSDGGDWGPDEADFPIFCKCDECMGVFHGVVMGGTSRVPTVTEFGKGGFNVKHDNDSNWVENVVKEENKKESFTDLETFYIEAHEKIRLSGLPNFQGEKIPIPTALNVDKWAVRLENYGDKDIVSLLKYGFPMGYDRVHPPVSSIINHNGAREFPEFITSYLEKEVDKGLVLGPWYGNYFNEALSISPLNSVPKKVQGERRVISDLSFPEGQSVNDGINKDVYLGEQVALSYPTVDSLATILKEKPPGSHIFKKDLKRAYRQFLLDPGDIHFCGYMWEGKLFVDLALVMGARSAAQLCQRVTNSVSYMAENMGILCLNYLDDLCCVANPSDSLAHYHQITELLSELGLEEARDKAVEPSTEVEFLGVQFNTIKQTMEVTPEKLSEIKELVSVWLAKSRASKRELQSLIGKLMFVAKCVLGSRVFVSRLLAALRPLKKQNHRFKINAEFRKDLVWWQCFLEKFNGICYIPNMNWTAPDLVMSTDACLAGAGGWCDKEFFSTEFPEFILSQNHHINVLELWTVLLGLRLWYYKFRNSRIQIYCDNQVSVLLINSGRGKDKVMLSLLREILFICCNNGIQIRAVHLPGVENRLADELSRARGANSKIYENLVGKDWLCRSISDSDFKLQNNW